MTLLSISSLTAGYGGAPILSDVKMTVSKAELVVVVGPNGAGKSTLLKCIAGLTPRVTGNMEFDGTSLSGLRAEDRIRLGLAYVPQSANVFPSLSVGENLELGYVGERRNRSRNIKQRMSQVLDTFPDLRTALRRQAVLLSGGQRQALAFGKALMAEPSLMLLDEPSAGLSPMLVEQMFGHIAALVDAGIAALLIEQNARQALSVGHRGYVLEGGRNALTGTGQELLHDPRTVDLYLGRKARVDFDAADADAQAAADAADAADAQAADAAGRA